MKWLVCLFRGHDWTKWREVETSARGTHMPVILTCGRCGKEEMNFWPYGPNGEHPLAGHWSDVA